MWLWCVRTQQWKAVKVWISRNVTAESVVDEHKVAATITTLKRIEGLLILYVKEVTNRNINALMTLTEIKHDYKEDKGKFFLIWKNRLSAFVQSFFAMVKRRG
ncbi:uncharacterized protein [Cardiocondyla obscurior]|uniref:uncharacterized protein n=1 Tax=Cardiocondyla obscurior TaxID=286306 RepID=UPI0039656A21